MAYKAQGLFITGFTVAEVLAILAKAKEDLTNGRIVTSYSTGGTSASRKETLPVDQVLAECSYALKALDPDTYGYNRSTRRVHANFNKGGNA